MIRADAAHLPILTASIDLVLTSMPTDLGWSTRIRALSEIGRVTRPGGRIVIMANVPGQHLSAAYRYPVSPSGYIRTLIGLNSAIGDRVLDCFAGSQVIPDLATKMGRIGIASELYVL